MKLRSYCTDSTFKPYCQIVDAFRKCSYLPHCPLRIFHLGERTDGESIVTSPNATAERLAAVPLLGLTPHGGSEGGAGAGAVGRAQSCQGSSPGHGAPRCPLPALPGHAA